GAVELGPLQAEFEAEHLRLETLPFVCAHARGELDARIVVNDPLGVEPSGEARLSVKGFRAAPLVAYEGQRADETLDIVLESKVDARHVEARGELVAGPRRSTLEGRMPLRIEKGRVTVADDAPLFARVRLEHLPISPLLDPKGSISYASGTVHGGVELNGTWSDPRFNGEISLEKVGFTATDLAQPLRDVQGKLRFSEREAHIENFVALDGDGRLLLDGSAHFEKLDHVQAAFHIRTEEFPLRQMGQVVARLDFDAEVQTRVEPKETKVEIAIVEADMWIEDAKFRTGIPLDLHPDFVVDGQDADGHRVASPLVASTSAQSASPASAASPASPAQPASPASASPPATTDLPPPPTRTTLLRLESRERFWIKRSDFAVNLATHLDTVIEGDEANVKGDVLIERGYLTLLGKTFDFERGGKLTFIGGPTPDPVIDLTAVYDNRRTGDQVKVHITGRGSKPIIEFLLNDKKVEAGDAFGAIYGSQGTNQNAQSAPAQAAGFVGGLTAGLLATSARRELGAAAPIIMVEPGEKAGEGRVRAGFELDSLVPQFLRDVITGVYVEGIVARESANSRSSTTASQAGVRYGILLEFYYPKNFFSTAQYGPGSTWSLDLGWQL
ncbi:MAG TPA: translocation/assembly module TamB domain-containing protein, partial [Polyangiaceae bacterium]|nr:translocation/assembly module TamB domain-containing protein [Polyangiaceae bacterium]